MSKIDRYELMYTRLAWFLISAGFLFSLYSNLINPNAVTLYTVEKSVGFITAFYTVSYLLCGLKYYLLKKGLFNNNLFYFVYRFIEIFAAITAILFTGAGHWIIVMLAFSILLICLCKGIKAGLFVITGSLFVAGGAFILSQSMFPNEDLQLEILIIFFYYLAFAMFAVLCSMIHKDILNSERENKDLLKQLGEKYEQLEFAQEEIKHHYAKAKETNSVLEDTNKKLTSSIAEFYTLQQISQAISSILDIKELLKYVNDIILGVMGVNNSTIILYDESRARLKVHTTNIKNHNELVILNDNINCPILMDALYKNRSLLENFVDSEEYPFTAGREANSLICVPLGTKSRKFGLVIIEHKYYSAFEEENVRLLETIGLQVGIAMENAELYQKMQELATKDGLTGVYNRLYFQERLQSELHNAQAENYPLSVAIFDIDHFKKFNDTYGHLFGDQVLKSIVELVKGSLRSSDVLARFGGEEFVILFPHMNLKEAYEKVESLRLKIAQTYIKDTLVTAAVTVSFGISSYPETASMENDLLSHADFALYEAKLTGRNCVRTAKVAEKAV